MSELRAIDADGHITEFHVDWAARFPADLRERAPRVMVGDQSEPTAPGEYSRTNSLLIDGYRYPDPTIEGRGRWATRRVPVRANKAGMSDPLQRLPDMDAYGLRVPAAV